MKASKHSVKVVADIYFIASGVWAEAAVAAGATAGDTGSAQIEVLYLLPEACNQSTIRYQLQS